MRFSRQKRLREAFINNDEEVITKFLWFPLTIKGETRWLEKAEIKYKVNWECAFLSERRVYYWEAVKFLNE